MARLGIGNPLIGIIAALALAAPPAVIVAAAQAKPAYQQLIERYPAPKLADVDAREFKVLIEPAQTKSTVEEGFKDLWTRIRAAAVKQGLTVTEKAKDPLAIEFSTKEYFDTADQTLWNRGYLLRITTRYKDGKPNPQVAVTVKSILDDAEKTLAVPLAVVGVDKFKTEAEDNVGFVPGGGLRGYVEKGSSFSVPLAALGGFTVGDFGKFMPELLKLGLPAETPLQSRKAYSYRVRPGAVVLPGTEPCGISMEAWSATEGGAPYLYDFSFGYDDIDFYALGATHAAGEQFVLKVFKGELAGLGGADGDKWGGSKVRKMMNRPASASLAAAPQASTGGAASAPAKAAAIAAMAVAFTTSALPPADPLDALYGVPSQPAYIKHYEADKAGKVLLNPYLQVASKDFPAVLSVKEAPYNWVIDASGRVAIIPEAAHPYGRTYDQGFFRPEDQSQRKPGTRENYGHVSALGGAPGRISGEILYDKDTSAWVLNNKSGRYTKHNTDRSPEQMVNAAKLIREVVDPGKTQWGTVFFLLEYASPEMQSALQGTGKVQYDDPAKKTRPHLVVMEGGATTFKPEEMPKVAAPGKAASPAVSVAGPSAASAAAASAPAGKAKKAKAAHNDDPS